MNPIARVVSRYRCCQYYLAPTPVILFVNQPSGICSPPFLAPTPPPPSDRGFADANDSFLALVALCTVGSLSFILVNKHDKGCTHPISQFPRRSFLGPHHLVLSRLECDGPYFRKYTLVIIHHQVVIYSLHRSGKRGLIHRRFQNFDPRIPQRPAHHVGINHFTK